MDNTYFDFFGSQKTRFRDFLKVELLLRDLVDIVFDLKSS